MNEYLSWKEKITSDFSPDNISTLYTDGFVFTRIGKGVLNQTRSVRIDLSKFELNSENKRILRKTEDVILEIKQIPYSDYSWEIHKLGFDFYETKFGEKTFSAQKIKELITDENKTNFNTLLKFCHYENPPVGGDAANPLIIESRGIASPAVRNDTTVYGYCICYMDKDILHYCYPFYDLDSEISNLGIGMMTKAIVCAKEQNLKYVYLGSAKDSKALYKFQFEGIEWFNGKNWQTDITELKKIL
ncbi:MAG: hypothetical protein Q7J14_01540 [Candidatus Magasanikbacteria bacterium]|nr:hypothetical protein [Candidatus Magasanikbacteria bacterium]